MGFMRTSEDLKKACVNPDAGKAAMQWVLDLFDKHKVSTRDVSDRYKAFGTGQGSIFWTGPWGGSAVALRTGLCDDLGDAVRVDGLDFFQIPFGCHVGEHLVFESSGDPRELRQ